MVISTSKSGKTVHIDVGIWYAEEDGHIRMKVADEGLTSVSNDPKSKRYHRTLYKKLADILRKQGIEVP